MFDQHSAFRIAAYNRAFLVAGWHSFCWALEKCSNSSVQSFTVIAAAMTRSFRSFLFAQANSAELKLISVGLATDAANDAVVLGILPTAVVPTSGTFLNSRCLIP